MDDLDSLLQELGGPQQTQKTPPQPQRPQPQRASSGASDDLDALLGELEGSKPQQQPQQQQRSYVQPQRAQSGADDLDALLGELGEASKPQQAQQRPQAQRSFAQPQRAQSGADDLDALLGELGGAAQPQQPQQPQRATPSYSQPQQPQRSQSKASDDLDALLGELGDASSRPQQPQQRQQQQQQRSTSYTQQPQQPQRQSSSSFSSRERVQGGGDNLDNLLKSVSNDLKTNLGPDDLKKRSILFTSEVLKFQLDHLPDNNGPYRFRIHAKREVADTAFPTFVALRLSRPKRMGGEPIDFDWSTVTWEQTTEAGFEKVASLKLPGISNVNDFSELQLLFLFPPFHHPPILSLGPFSVFQ